MPTPPQTTYLSDVIADQARITEALNRRKPLDFATISEVQIGEYEAQGWQIDKHLKTKVRMSRQKLFDERLENRFWMLLFKLGYPELNRGRNFNVLIKRKGADPIWKQIDVFAKDAETVIVAECKACEQMKQRSLQKDIEEFANLKGSIAQSVTSHYGMNFKPKIIWMFVTENVIWSKPDKDRAIGQHIHIIKEKELRYYAQIAEHLGKAARYQFLAEFLQDQDIPELRNKTVPAIRGKLGGRKFYSFVTRPRDLLKISFVNHRSLNDPEAAPTYQRIVSKSRIRDIGKFIKFGGYFPNNILVNFNRAVRFDRISHDEDADVTFGTMYFPDKYRSAWIIDGQHRLYGFSPIDDKYLDQNIIVVAFEKLEKIEEARLFVTINHEQKSVPKHLLDDLEGELKWGSDIPSERIGAIAARLINNLNADMGCPFYNRITLQGITSTNKTCLTIPALKDALRRSSLLGKAIQHNSNYELGPLCGTTDTQTLEKAWSALSIYFEYVRNSNLTDWEKGRAGSLCTNVAVQAYIMLLADLIKYCEMNTAASAKEMTAEEIMSDLEEYVQPLLTFLSQATSETLASEFDVPFGSGGLPEYFFRLCRIIKQTFQDFKPDGLDQWEAEQSEEHIRSADQKIKDIVVFVQDKLFGVLRTVYGTEKEAYWHKGITDKELKSKAYSRSLDADDESRMSLENYLDVIDYKKIIENKQNWPHLKPFFDIPEIGEKGQAKNVKWLDKVNELRRIAAHPSKERHYKMDDYEYLDYIYEELLKLNSDDATSTPATLAEVNTNA